MVRLPRIAAVALAAWPGLTSIRPSPLVAQAPVNGVTLTTEAIARRAVPATVTILAYGPQGDTLGMGSGFLVRSNGVVVTNYHVMAGAVRAEVVLSSGERYDRVEALDADQRMDIAILKIPGYGLPTLPVTAALPPVGAKLVTVGNPLGLQRTVSEGIVSAVRLIDGRTLLQMSAPISPGSSGGPVLNARGEVVAVATSYLAQGQNLNFAVPVRYAMGLVDGAGQPVPLASRFGTTSAAPPPTGAAGTPTSPGTSPAATNWRPPPTTTPRPAIEGTWELKELVAAAAFGRTVTQTYSGLLFLGAHDVGFLVQIQDSLAHPPGSSPESSVKVSAT